MKLNPFDVKVDDCLERAGITLEVMNTFGAAPYLWAWDGISGGGFTGLIDGVEDQIDLLATASVNTKAAALTWDSENKLLVDDSAQGTRAGKVKFKSNAVKFGLLKALRYPTVGRDKMYKQAHEFEKVWGKVDAAWVFKTGLTLPIFKTRREGLLTLEDTYMTASVDESHERGLLHTLTDGLNEVCVDWYGIAKGHFDGNSTAMQLLSTIPTTYDPNRPPGQLRFTVHMASGPNTVHLGWRAARGQHYTILAKRPGAEVFEAILENVTDKEWIGLAMEAGEWQFKGLATNEHGEGEESEVISITVANVLAA